MKKLILGNNSYLTYAAELTDDKINKIKFRLNSEEPKEGEIYKGRISRIVPALKCAFINIGASKEGFLYLDRKYNNLDIKKDDEILVQVIKEQKDSKGPKVSNIIDFQGKLCALTFKGEGISYSKKLKNEFVLNVKDKIIPYEDVKITIRTAAEKATIDEINFEIKKLYEEYKKLVLDFNFYKSPKKLTYEDEFLLREINNTDLNSLDIILTKDEYIKKIKGLGVNIPIEAYSDDIFSKLILKNLEKLMDRKVYLKNGGFIIIEKTEALWSIDVNSGKNVSGKTIEKNAYITNKEAALKIASEIIIRNLSGIIIIDFIDMSSEAYKKDIINILSEELSKDKTQVMVFPQTELNLVQITRKRRGPDIYEVLTDNNFFRKTRYKLTYNLFCDYVKLLSKNTFYEYSVLKVNPIYFDYISKEEFIKDAELTEKNVKLELSSSCEVAYFAREN